MNVEVDEAAEERKGGSGHLGKMLLSAGQKQVIAINRARGWPGEVWVCRLSHTVCHGASACIVSWSLCFALLLEPGCCRWLYCAVPCAQGPCHAHGLCTYASILLYHFAMAYRGRPVRMDVCICTCLVCMTGCPPPPRMADDTTYIARPAPSHLGPCCSFPHAHSLSMFHAAHNAAAGSAVPRAQGPAGGHPHLQHQGVGRGSR